MSGNHLAGQRSPYLVAHASDPVDWYPWGPAAFEAARESGRPVFLSVGYASCHWCHVMQRESFLDPDTAAFLAEHFVSVKVDRELRPDVDHLYMTYLMATSGRGGWPMSIFLTEDLRPFFGGTYFPKDAPAGGMYSFCDVLKTVSRMWRDNRRAVQQTADKAVSVLARHQSPVRGAPPDKGFIERCIGAILELEDTEHGGLAGAPKFPQAPLLGLLVAYHRVTHDEGALRMMLRWLYGMIRGGVYDQAGGGLFRYSTDERWRLPHFEKMLYDNAQLLSVIGEVFRACPSDELAAVAHETAAFMRRELGRPGGRGFFSSLDAESEEIEGGAYTWTLEQLASVLDPGELALAREHLWVLAHGERQGGPAGVGVLVRPHGRGDPRVDALLAKLATARAERPRPRLIRNTLTSWNALAARGLLEAGRWLGDEAMVGWGIETLEWLLKEAVDGDDVVHAVDDPSVADVRLLEDYAAVADALVAVPKRLRDEDLHRAAERLLRAAVARFEHDGVLYETPGDTELPLRPIRWEDTATPSAFAQLAGVALALGERAMFVETLMRHLRAVAEAAPSMFGAALTIALDTTRMQDGCDR